MYTREDISDFFDLEVEAATNSWEALMKLPIKERIRKRKAIRGVYLDRDYDETNDEGYYLLRLTVGVNLADFKEGEYMVLHREDERSGIKCQLYEFQGDDAIIIDVFPPDMPAELDDYYGQPLLLDKAMVDLRQNIYNNFLAVLPYDKNYWDELLLNKKPAPVFVDRDKCVQEIDETCQNFKLKLLPCQREAIVNSLSAKDYYLIQGPPGTGKSYVLGWIVLEEMCFFNHKVVVIGPNHKAINNALWQVVKSYPQAPVIKVGQSFNAPRQTIEVGDEEKAIFNAQHLNVQKVNDLEHAWVIGLTPHSLYTSRARGLRCDTLVIDEAGQMTIPLALMGMIKANKVILAGDFKQLPPIISSDKIRDEMRMSAFQAMMTDENCTMLDVSFRMNETICGFVSELFYNDRLKTLRKGSGNKMTCDDPLYSFDTPIVIHEVNDNGEQASDKEAMFIADVIAGYLDRGLPANEIAVLSPFRAQAANVRRHIKAHGNISEEQREGITADTIDKMQGQERDVIIFSMVSGKLDYMTEMADFLYNPNKLNVAFSRARSKLIIVGNISQIRKIGNGRFPHLGMMLASKYVTFL